MTEILYRAAAYLMIIVAGAGLKRVGVFGEGDFKTLAKVMLNITLPCAIISNFSGIEIDYSLLILTVFGIGAGAVFMMVAYFAGKLSGKKTDIPFDMINLSGYNIGNFSMPFAQSFLGPMGVVTISLFDTGNALICNGGSKAVAQMYKDGKNSEKKNRLTELKHSIMMVLKVLVKSPPFMTYFIMTVLVLVHVPVPGLIRTFTQTVAQANAFVAMLMIGVGFKLNLKGDGLAHVARILICRYLVTVVFIVIAYKMLPFSLEVRQALVILLLSPLASANPAFTDALGEDFELASTVNSIAMLISIVAITTALIVML